jgi:hypothetical protein
LYIQTEDYANGLAVLQLAYNVGLLTEDAEVRRLADLLVFNDVPYRGGQILETAIEEQGRGRWTKSSTRSSRNCWIAPQSSIARSPP